MARMTQHRGLILALAVGLAAFNLRPAIVAVGSVLDQISTAYDAPGTLSGLLTSLPGICFALFGVAAVPLSRRLGLTGTLVLAMSLEVIGQLVRPLMGNMWGFIALTGLVVMGIALVNVLLPAWVKSAGGRASVRLMTIYTTVLSVGMFLGPLSPMVTDSWRGVLWIWAATAALQLPVWIWLWRSTPTAPQPLRTPEALHGTLWRSPLAVAIMVFFGLQSMNAYIQMGWLPTILMDAGASSQVASISLALVGGLGIIGGMIVPRIVARSAHTHWVIVGFATCTATGYLGLTYAPMSAPYLWSALLGVGGFCFLMALALMPARTAAPEVTARLSAFVQSVGYLLAAAGPLLVGAAHEALGRWEPILWALLLSSVVMGIVGWRAGREGSVDAQLAGQAGTL
ncbi:MFS transporter [Corynebacterium lowii]|uniref:Inner membrane transport protein YeaN n=1 Tax=Corynebacterium lowii TaxID=1544413 RepID=A0A0Q0UDN8_9CORY|nr:MFS transporter [Corynebacterium lowii]KQB85998.1 Inner membrane transport protein YeaN [Corynebacterium lowii]MDP9850572.1 CP family cyanate transporter-like MFS transporter [Corynebacterium lowii]